MKKALSSFSEAIKRLESYQKFGIRPGLKSIQLLLEKLEYPQKKYKTIHVAGSKGKGSVSALSAGILSCAGFSTGLYTSPHLISYRERVRLNGLCISESDFSKCAQKVFNVIDAVPCLSETTVFEVLTATAFLYFAEQKAQWVVLETGMGGRLDATNVTDSAVQVITNIELEHTQYLGKTIAEIAREKAGILRENSFLVTGATGKAIKEIEKKARSLCVKVWRYPDDIRLKINHISETGQTVTVSGPDFIVEDIFCPLAGPHQALNLALAVSAANILKDYGVDIDDNSIKNGIKGVYLPGRMSVITRSGKKYIVDSAHTPRSASSCAKTIKKYFGLEKVNIIFGLLKDKDCGAIIKELVPIANKAAVVRINNERAIEENVLADKWSGVLGRGNVKAFSSLRELLESVDKIWKDELSVLVIGSVYLAGELYKEAGLDIRG